MQMEQQSDIDLSFDGLLAAYGRRLYIYCFHMLRSKPDAEDAVQEVFTKLYMKKNDISKINNLQAWLYKIAYNHCLNVLRRRQILSFIPLQSFQSEKAICTQQDILEEELSHELESGLMKLSPNERTVLLLRVLEDKSYEEISSITGSSCGTVRKQFERARKKISQYINSCEGVKANETAAIL